MTTEVNVVAILVVFVYVTVPVTVVPATALVGIARVVLTSVKRGAIVHAALLLARVTSGTALALALAVMLADAVPTNTLTGTATLPLGGNVCVVVTTMPFTTTVDTNVVATLVRLVYVTIPVTVVPATALVGNAIVVLTSVKLGVMDAAALLLANVISGTVLPLALADTLAPLGPTNTLMGSTTLPLGNNVCTVVDIWPLTVIAEVNVVGTAVLLV